MSPSPRMAAETGSVPAPLDPALRDLAERCLSEDVGRGDVTTRLTIDPGRRGKGTIRAGQDLVVSGTRVAAAVFAAADPRMAVAILATAGSRLEKGRPLMRVSGSCASILTAERTALNFLQHLCGIATQAAAAQALVRGTGVRLLDTRKTTPGLRRLEKEAVRAGGVFNHRNGLDDGILIKDNHLACSGSPAEAIRRAREHRPALLQIEIEIDRLEDLEPVIEAQPDAVLLDNFSVAEVAEAVRLVRGRVFLETSGRITLDSIRAYAETGVDAISLGFLTHSASAADLSLDLEVRRDAGAS